MQYILTDNHQSTGARRACWCVRIDDTAPNRPPVANADSDRVVIGNSVKIPVTANDLDPDHDVITSVVGRRPGRWFRHNGREGNSVRFTPNLPDITEPTPVTFTYKISDGHGNDATGKVTVTVLFEALPKPPFARDDFADTETDKPVTIDVLANDTDPSGGGQPHLTTNPVCAGGGDAKRTPDDRVTFTPPRGETGTFRLQVHDQQHPRPRSRGLDHRHRHGSKTWQPTRRRSTTVRCTQASTSAGRSRSTPTLLADDADGDRWSSLRSASRLTVTTNFSGQIEHVHVHRTGGRVGRPDTRCRQHRGDHQRRPRRKRPWHDLDQTHRRAAHHDPDPRSAEDS